MTKRHYALCLALAIATGCTTQANQTDAATVAVEATPSAEVSNHDFYLRIADRLARVDPYVHVERIRTSAREGFHEIHLFSETAGDQLAYVSDDLKTMFLGDMIDLETGTSITGISALSVRAELLDQVRDSTIAFDAQDERYQFFVFTQPDCDECVQLHEEIPQLNAAGISVQYVAFPDESLESDSAMRLSAAWCAQDGRSAITQALHGVLEGSQACQETVAEHFGLGLRFGVTQAPTLISANGIQIDGYPGATALIQALQSQEAEG